MDDHLLTTILKVLMILALLIFVVYGILIIVPAVLVSMCGNV